MLHRGYDNPVKVVEVLLALGLWFSILCLMAELESPGQEGHRSAGGASSPRGRGLCEDHCLLPEQLFSPSSFGGMNF